MPAEFLYPFTCKAESPAVKAAKKGKNKTKYTCCGCETNIWGKGGLAVECTDCKEYFVEAA
jgi:hypothetical protein